MWVRKDFPSFFWIHGGGFFAGTGNEYNPQFFMDEHPEDVIVVTINYRLGVFGFLSTGDEVVPGNNGLKDQVLALRWVQKHIQKFGGNPESVTIAGESAGSGSTHHLLLSPTTKGLFHRVISQSGTALNTWAYMPNPRQYATKLATYLNCSTVASNLGEISSDEMVSCFKDLSTDDLNKAQINFLITFPLNALTLYFAPVVEPKPIEGSTNIPFQTETPLALLTEKTKNLKEIPWLVGMTQDEGASVFGGMILGSPDLTAELNDNWDELVPRAFIFERYFGPKEQAVVTEKMKQFYFAGGKVSLDPAVRKGITDMYSDSLMTYGTHRAALETASKGSKHPVYLYEFAHKPEKVMAYGEIPEEEASMVGHGNELFYQFDFTGTWGLEEPILKPGSRDEQFSKHFIRLWVSFAVHGYPKYSWGTEQDNKWAPISNEEASGAKPLKWFRIDMNPKFIDHPFSARLSFLEQLFKDHFEPAIRNSRKPGKSEL